jgi:cobalt/nickel transport system ATP-binding protein
VLQGETVFEEVAFAPMQLDLGEKEAQGRADELLAMLGISALRDRAPYSLSSGEKKKVAIASVLSTNPDVILMDEPTNGLDPRSQVWLIGLIEEFKALGKTLVISTHDLSLVEDLSDRVVLLDESHGVAAVGGSLGILKDKDLLLRVNVIHEHTHRHGDVLHTHSHGPYATHDDHD